MGKWVEARLVVSRITNQSTCRKHIDSNKYILIHTHPKKKKTLSLGLKYQRYFWKPNKTLSPRKVALRHKLSIGNHSYDLTMKNNSCGPWHRCIKSEIGNTLNWILKKKGPSYQQILCWLWFCVFYPLQKQAPEWINIWKYMPKTYQNEIKKIWC